MHHHSLSVRRLAAVGERGLGGAVSTKSPCADIVCHLAPNELPVENLDGILYKQCHIAKVFGLAGPSGSGAMSFHSFLVFCQSSFQERLLNLEELSCTPLWPFHANMTPLYPSIMNLEEDLGVMVVGNIQPTPQCLVTRLRLLGELKTSWPESNGSHSRGPVSEAGSPVGVSNKPRSCNSISLLDEHVLTLRQHSEGETLLQVTKEKGRITACVYVDICVSCSEPRVLLIS